MSTAPAPNFTPEFVLGLRAVLLEGLRNEVGITAKVIAAVPNDPAKHSYKPDPKSKSAWDLAWHIAGADAMFVKSIARAKFDFAEEEELLNNSPVKSTGEMAEWYTREMNRYMEEIAKLPADKLAQSVQFFHFNLPNVLYLNFATNHSIHHRGQLSTYLRPMGSKIPSIYGGSADEPMS